MTKDQARNYFHSGEPGNFIFDDDGHAIINNHGRQNLWLTCLENVKVKDGRIIRSKRVDEMVVDDAVEWLFQFNEEE